MKGCERILVMGSSGQVGSELKQLYKNYTHFEWIFSNKKDLDLSKINKISKYLNKVRPTIIINCAAYTDVDKAEKEPKLADSINNIAVAELAKLTKKNQCKLIHLSTDYVFDGSKKTPYTEKDQCNSINIYGKTKLDGEISCLKNNPNAIILRTSWFFSIFGNNFLKNICHLMINNLEISVVDDQYGNPTYAKDLALVICKIINHNEWIPGIFHYTNANTISWYKFATEIKKISRLECQINAVSTQTSNNLAKRPLFSALNTEKIKNTYGIVINNYIDGLETCLSKNQIITAPC